MLPVDLQILKYIFFEKPIYHIKIKPYLKCDCYQQLDSKIEAFEKDQTIEKQSLKNLDYTIFDLETTGFLPEIGHEIISIGAIRLKGLEACHRQTFYRVIRPIRPVSKQTLQLTGLRKEQIENSISFIEGFQEFMDFSEGSVLVAHPAKFDMRFLRSMLKRWKLPDYDPAVIDSQLMAQWLLPSVKYQLDPLLRYFNIEKRNRHHALNDAIMTSELFRHLLNMTLEEDVKTLAELNSVLHPNQKQTKPF